MTVVIENEITMAVMARTRGWLNSGTCSSITNWCALPELHCKPVEKQRSEIKMKTTETGTCSIITNWCVQHEPRGRLLISSELPCQEWIEWIKSSYGRWIGDNCANPPNDGVEFDGCHNRELIWKGGPQRLQDSENERLRELWCMMQHHEVDVFIGINRVATSWGMIWRG